MSLNETLSRALGMCMCCGTNWPTEVVEIATLHGFDENDRFFTTSCDPYKGNTPRLVHTFHHKKDTRDGF
jgi:hypothetical protein